MPTTVAELYGSRSTTTGSSGSHERKYDVLGTDDEEDAIDAVVSTAPDSYGGSGNLPYMRRVSIEVDPVHVDEDNTSVSRWLATVKYAVPSGNTGGSGDVGDSAQFSFDTSGGTRHIQYSIDTVDSAGIDVTTPYNYNRAIEVEDNGGKRSIKGCDIVAPAYNWKETVYLSDSVDAAYKMTLMELTGTVNEAEFNGFGIGCVLFLGAQGSRRADGTWELTYSFSARKGEDNFILPFGDYPAQPDDCVGPVTVRGWDYVWAEYRDHPGDDLQELRPIAVYVEQVYKLGDFTQLIFVEF